MKTRTLLRTGITGSVVAAVCCATPLLVLLLGAVGLSAWVGWLDYVLIPALLGFGILTLYAWRRQRAECTYCEPDTEPGPERRKSVSNG
ncbi:mercury resistance system transport protein MerF [Aromatoleum toluclasticum]|uniref:mercury resistance system transport protein MerF n=1 Tax=Aromatoleum toluclasticum TaxID=92003 RepID=UPI001D195F51|nr:mercury resistance system transport protein MerF [Aromatoleum toluclasticum]MCC4118144.1 mercury resistance system transport protein MerF [Aromatoleum toluclasticum]